MRGLIIVASFGWYLAVRCIIYFYFMRGQHIGWIPPVRTKNDDEFFDWWFAWGIAIPVTAFTLLLTFVFVPELFRTGGRL